MEMESKLTQQTRNRLTLDLSERITSALGAYAEKRGITKAEALRNAVELLLVAENASDDGLKVGAWSNEPDRRLEREFVGFGL